MALPLSWITLMAICLGLGMATGWVLHRSDFCLAGAFRDFLLFRRRDRLQALALAIALSALLFEAAHLCGWVSRYPFPLLGEAGIAPLMGGFLFGVGMVMAGGCVLGTLYRAGAGHLSGLLAILGLILGSAFYAEIHPTWRELTSGRTWAAGELTLAQVLAIPSWLLIVPAAGAILLFLPRRLRRVAGDLQPVAGYLPPARAAAWLAFLGFGSWLLTGMPLGITTAYAKAAATLEKWTVPSHLAHLDFFASRPLELTIPIWGEAFSGGPTPEFDVLAAIQVPLIFGILLGSAWSARRLGELRFRWRLPRRQVASALAGGVLMGLAARLAPACNVWHLLGGLPILATQSLCFLLGLWPGAWLGSRLLVTLVIPGQSLPPQPCFVQEETHG